MDLDGWLAKERQAGTLESSGHFSVDLLKARIKLARFQLQPGLYLAKLVQAGVAAGCRRLDIRIDGGLLMRFDDPQVGALPWEQIAAGLEAPQSLASDLPVASLVTGILAAHGDAGQPLTFRSSDGYRIDLRDGEVKASQAPADSGSNWCYLWLSHVGCAQERRVLQSRCGYCPIPLHLDSLPFNDGWASELHDGSNPLPRLAEFYWGGKEPGLGLPDKAGERLQLREGEPPWGGAIAVSVRMEGPSWIRWVIHGVVVASEELPAYYRGLVVVASADGLAVDFSQFALVRSRPYAKRRREVLRQLDAFLETLVQRICQLRIPPAGALERATATGLAGFGLAAVGPMVLPGLGEMFVLGGCLVSTAVALASYFWGLKGSDEKAKALASGRLREMCMGASRAGQRKKAGPLQGP